MDENELKRRMVVIRALYRNKGEELTDEEVRVIAEQHSLRKYWPQFILIIVVIVILVWRFL